MANLIITIIGIALIAVAAIMGVYYGGIAFQNNQVQVTANTIISESQQILTAQRVWALNQGQADATGATMVTLVNDGEISYPTGSLSALGVTIPTTVPAYEFGLPMSSCGNNNVFTRMVFTYNSGNYVAYSLPSYCPAFFPIAVAINNTLGVDAHALQPHDFQSLSNGVPIPAYSSIITEPPAWFAGVGSQVSLDYYGNMLSNMCYVSSGGVTECVFGPS